MVDVVALRNTIATFLQLSLQPVSKSLSFRALRQIRRSRQTELNSVPQESEDLLMGGLQSLRCSACDRTLSFAGMCIWRR